MSLKTWRALQPEQRKHCMSLRPAGVSRPVWRWMVMRKPDLALDHA